MKSEREKEGRGQEQISTGELLLEFFRFYGKTLDTERCGISIRTNEIFEKVTIEREMRLCGCLDEREVDVTVSVCGRL
jgi:DNA polymerase sigma